MSDLFWIIGEIIVGIALLGLLSAVVTAVMVPLLSKHPKAEQILEERYARGELTREQYAQMRQDIGIGGTVGGGLSAPAADGREVGGVSGSRPAK